MAIADWFLIGAACITSMIAAVGGVGGGVVLIAIMPGFLPAAAIIPVHGLVQIASNLSRALIGFKHTEWRLVGQYAIGAVIGAALGSRFIADIEWETMPLFLGIFILLITWMPKFSRAPDLPAKFTLLGAFQTALSLFFWCQWSAQYAFSPAGKPAPRSHGNHAFGSDGIEPCDENFDIWVFGICLCTLLEIGRWHDRLGISWILSGNPDPRARARTSFSRNFKMVDNPPRRAHDFIRSIFHLIIRKG